MAKVTRPELEERRAARRAWYAKNRESILRKNTEWRKQAGYKPKQRKPYSAWTEEQKEKWRAYKRDWVARNPERTRAYRDAVLANGKQGMSDRSAYHREYYARNKERILARQKANWPDYFQANIDKVRAKGRDYYARNREIILERQRAYYAKNIEKMRARSRDYYACVRRIAASAPQYEEMRRKALLANPFYAAADAAISRSLPPFMRSDIISMIVEAGYRGELKVEDVPTSARAFISQYYRDYGSVYGTASLDDVIPGTDLTTMDTIVYEGAGVGFETDDEPDDEDAFFMDELV